MGDLGGIRTDAWAVEIGLAEEENPREGRALLTAPEEGRPRALLTLLRREGPGKTC